MKAVGLHMVTAVLAGAALSRVVLASPIAPHPPLSDMAKKIEAARSAKGGKGPAAVPPCPDAAVVGIPAFPGSWCVAKLTIRASGGKTLPELVLVSRAAPATVRHWYAQHLSGWQYDARLHHFVHPGWTLARFLDEPEVHIAKATAQKRVLYRMSYDLAGVRTEMVIRYAPRKGRRS